MRPPIVFGKINQLFNLTCCSFMYTYALVVTNAQLSNYGDERLCERELFVVELWYVVSPRG